MSDMLIRIKRFTLTNILSDKARADAQNDSFVTLIQRQIDADLSERKLTTQIKQIATSLPTINCEAHHYRQDRATHIINN